MYSIGQCENQLYDIDVDKTRPAFLDYKSLATGKPYCVHGKTEDGLERSRFGANAVSSARRSLAFSF